MSIVLDGTTGVTTPGITDTGSATVAGTMAVTGAATAASLQVGGVTTNVYPLVSGTAQASTSGTSIDFTSIPSWVKRITVMLQGVSTSGTSALQVQIGSGSLTTTGYLSTGAVISGSNLTSTATFTSGFGLRAPLNATDILHGHMVLTNFGSNAWVESNVIGFTTNNYAAYGGGSITLGGTLDRVRITTVNGTDTFDAGSINILYE